MKDKIEKQEMLYRAIKRSRPDWLEKGKPTPVMFKDEKGNSVDRDDNRSIEEIVQFMRDTTFGKRLKGVVELNAGDCMNIGTKVVAAKTEKNPYHANIFLDDDEKMGTLQALMLADVSVVVYEDPEIKWVFS